MRHLARLLFGALYGFSPLWLAAILAQIERRGDLTASVKNRSE